MAKITPNDIADHIAVAMAGLDVPRPPQGESAIDWFLDLLDQVEVEREWLRAADRWPAALPGDVAFARTVYRTGLMVLENRLRRYIEDAARPNGGPDAEPVGRILVELIGAGKQLVSALSNAGTVQ